MRHRIYAASVILAVAAAVFSAGPAQAARSGQFLPCSPQSKDLLTYRGGYIEGDTSVKLIFWGNWWATHGSSVITEMKNLFAGLSGSSWAKTLTQYCDAYGDAPWTSMPSELAATYIDSVNPPTAPTKQQMANEAAKYATVPKGSYGPFAAGVPMIITPPGVTPAGDGVSGQKIQCGQHGWGPKTVGGAKIYFQWADVPYGVISSFTHCEHNQSAAQGMSLSAGHEWAETVTDPYVNGPGTPRQAQSAWASKSTKAPNQEIGDLCENSTDIYGNPVTDFWLPLSTGRFWMQPLWSNEAGPTTHQGACVNGS